MSKKVSKSLNLEINISIFFAILRHKHCQHNLIGGATMSRRGENIYKRKDGRWEGR